MSTEPIQFGDYTFINSPLLEGVQVDDVIELTIKCRVKRVLPDQTVGGLEIRILKGHVDKSYVIPIRAITEVKVVQHA